LFVALVGSLAALITATVASCSLNVTVKEIARREAENDKQEWQTVIVNGIIQRESQTEPPRGISFENNQAGIRK
jgi:hypothetical protein